jgi:hypothetical protein
MPAKTPTMAAPVSDSISWIKELRSCTLRPQSTSARETPSRASSRGSAERAFAPEKTFSGYVREWKSWRLVREEAAFMLDWRP